MDADTAMPEHPDALPRLQLPLSTAHDRFLQVAGPEAFHGRGGPQAKRCAISQSAIASDLDAILTSPTVGVLTAALDSERAD